MATKDKLVSLEVLKATTQADVDDLKSASAQQRSSITYLRGGYYASGLKAEPSNDSVSTGIINGGAVVTVADGTVYRILLYNNGQYIGKINSSYGIDKNAGNWWSFSGTTDMYKLLAEKQADAFALVILANGSDAPTESTYQAWGESHCTMYTGTMYAIGDARTRFDDLSWEVDDLKSTLTEAETVYTDWISGVHAGDTAQWQPNSGRCTINRVFTLHRNDVIAVRNVDSGLKFAIVGSYNGSNIYDSQWQTTDFHYAVPASADGASFFVNVTNDAQTLTPSGISTMKVVIMHNKIPYLTEGILSPSDDVNNFTGAGFYRAYAYQLPDNWPISGGGNLIVMRGDANLNTDSFGVCQAVYGADKILTRFGSGSTNWTDWQTYYSEGSSPDVANLKTNAYQKKPQLTESDDIDTIINHGFYRAYSNHLPQNWPVTTGGGNLIVMRGDDGNDSFGVCQSFWLANKILVRFGTGGTNWTDWLYYLSDADSKEDIIAFNNDDETKLKLHQLSSCRTLSTTLPVQPLTILHFSDLHENSTALKNIVSFKSYYSSYINDCIHTGDFVNNTSGTNVFNSVTGADSILNVIGNHETWDSANNWYSLTESETYTKYFSPVISNWSVTIGSNVCYYYKDYSAKNVRLIVLDRMHDSVTQQTWFANTLNGAKTAGYHVIIASHVIMGKLEDMTYLDSGFDNPVYPRDTTPDYGFPMYMPEAYITALDSFVSGGGIVVAWLAGHMHNDTLATYHNVLNIAITTSGAYTGVGATMDARDPGTRSADAFNVIGIDMVRGYLKLLRIGMNYNAAMKKVDTLCWDYINHRMIYTC